LAPTVGEQVKPVQLEDREQLDVAEGVDVGVDSVNVGVVNSKSDSVSNFDLGVLVIDESDISTCGVVEDLTVTGVVLRDGSTGSQYPCSELHTDPSGQPSSGVSLHPHNI
jgi:hypothetical protein